MVVILLLFQLPRRSTAEKRCELFCFLFFPVEHKVRRVVCS